jgi:hypothetical protein
MTNLLSYAKTFFVMQPLQNLLLFSSASVSCFYLIEKVEGGARAR